MLTDKCFLLRLPTQELRKLRNYHSLSAIATALGSMSIANMRVTREFLSDKLMAQYEELVQFTDTEGNHIRYRRALKEAPDPAYADCCIPWIGQSHFPFHWMLSLTNYFPLYRPWPFGLRGMCQSHVNSQSSSTPKRAAYGSARKQTGDHRQRQTAHQLPAVHPLHE